MASKELIEEVGKYIDKYYEPGTDDIKMDEEMKSIFDKITSFRKKERNRRSRKHLLTMRQICLLPQNLMWEA